MQAILKEWHTNSFYHFKKDKIVKKLLSDSECITNIASNEYSKCMTSYLKQDTVFITCIVGEIINKKAIKRGVIAHLQKNGLVIGALS